MSRPRQPSWGAASAGVMKNSQECPILVFSHTLDGLAPPRERHGQQHRYQADGADPVTIQRDDEGGKSINDSRGKLNRHSDSMG